MSDAATQRTVILSNAPAERGERLFAYAIIGVSGVVFLLLAPFAKLPLRPLPAFIPIYQSALIFNDVITVVFLLGQRQFLQSDALGLLAGAYLFTALMSAVHALTFPGLFSPTGLLGAGPQTTVWLYLFWHGGFPLFVIAYACCAPDQKPSSRSGISLCIGVGSACALVAGFALIAIRGQHYLPSLMEVNHYTPITGFAVSGAWLLNLLALGVLLRRRPYSVLDLWLIVTMCAWLCDIALSAGLNGGRYDLGFYVGRIYGLLAVSFVLIVLLVQNARLYVQLIKLRESERAKAAELERLNAIDPLTGIANRRAFDAALDQEWRRMMRHKTALSLLMIDVDYFKRFNDSYGHVGGDQCLRAVAQAIAGRARRAGELAARYGGEEFAVLLPQTDINVAMRLAELICSSVRELRITHEGSAVAPFVTISVGVASVADLPRSAATLRRDDAEVAPSAAIVVIEAADQALYRAKMAGRNRVAATGIDGGSAQSAAAPIPSAA